VLLPITTDLAIHPIHVLVEPISGHEDHALLNLPHHGVQLSIARAHAEDNLAAFLAHGRCEDEIVTAFLKFLRVSEWFCAVYLVVRANAEITSMRFELRVTPLVASPTWVRWVVASACMIGDLLHIHIPLIHVELVATTLTIEALGIAIVIAVIAGRGPGHTHKVEIQVATTRCSVRLKIHIHCEGLTHKLWHVEILSLAVVGCRAPHEVEAVWWCIFYCLATIHSCGTGQIIRVHHAVFIDLECSCLSPCERPSR
jgi:hypothetical protein